MKTKSKEDLKAKIRDLENKVVFIQGIVDQRDMKIEELYKRAESFKAQLIVYKGIVSELLDKLIERRDV